MLAAVHHTVWVVVAMRLFTVGWQPVQMATYDNQADCVAAAHAMSHAAGVKANSATCHQTQPPR